MRGRLIAVAAATAALALPGAADAAGWSKPAVVANAGAEDLVVPYYVQSPNGRKTDLVTGVFYGRDAVYPMTSRGRLLKPWRIPDRAGYNADYALNDAGATALVWLAESTNQPPADDRGPEYDWVRAAIRGPRGKFTRRRTITPGREITGWEAAITPSGAATAFASVWNPYAAGQPLRVADARPYRRFGKPRVVVPNIGEWVLDSRRGRPTVLYEKGNTLLELASPWTHPATLGNLPSDFSFETGDFASDGSGNDLMVDDRLAVSHRPPGGTFGPFRTIATHRPADDCSVAATMNRRLALAAWICENESTARVQIAILDRSGRLRWRSKLFPAWWGGETPTLALDRAGRWAVAWQVPSRNDRFRALTGRGSRPGRVLGIPGPSAQSDPPSLAVLPGGIAHAAWSNQTRKATYVLESRLRIR